MTIKEKLATLRKLMEREGLDAYIISGTDPHNNEYLPAAWQQREWISGFTGSFGTVVVLKEDAGLWTDTRYFIQAEKQLQDTGIRLHKLRIADAIDYPEWLASVLPADSRVGADSFCTSVNEWKHLQAILEEKNIKLVDNSCLIGEIWLDRPALPEGKIFSVSPEITGTSISEKIGMIQNILKDRKADYFLFSALDEIAWLYNIRGNDIAYNPVAISYAIVEREKSHLFIKPSKVGKETALQLGQANIEIHDYHHLFLFLEQLEKGKHFCIDSTSLNYAVFHRLTSLFVLEEVSSPVILAKALKTEKEIEGFRKACLKDSVAMTKFFYWLYRNIDNQLTETEVSRRLTAFRSQNEG